MRPFAAMRSSRYADRLRRALHGRRVLVTGASSGIGRAFALQAAAAGADLALLARRSHELAEVAGAVRRAGGTATTHPGDLSALETLEELAAEIAAAGPVDVLVHNAGISIRRPIVDTTREDLERLVAVDYLGAAVLTLALLPSMRARGAGHIVQVSTIGVLTGAPNFSGYVAAKAAADHFARTLRLELGGEGIRVTRIAMPLVRTPMMAPSRIYRAFPALDVEEAARRIGWAIVRRPLHVAPWWTTVLELLEVMCPSLLQWTFTRAHGPFHAWMARRLARRERAGQVAPAAPADGASAARLAVWAREGPPRAKNRSRW